MRVRIVVGRIGNPSLFSWTDWQSVLHPIRQIIVLQRLNCLVALELKVEEFQPEHLGKLEFYLEALDRDVKKPHERPSIGVLLCATKDHEVVEYALSRAVSPALVAEYQTRLPDKKHLEATPHEFYQLAQQQATLRALDAPPPRPTSPRRASTGKRRKK